MKRHNAIISRNENICKLDLRKIYENFNGKEPIIELPTKLAEKIVEVAHDYEKNERKHRNRLYHSEESGFDFEQDSSRVHNFHYQPVVASAETSAKRKAIREHLFRLTPTQRKRVILYTFFDFTEREIAKIEKVKQTSVHESLNVSFKKIRSYLKSK